MAHSPVQGNLPGMQVSQVYYETIPPENKVKVTARTKCTLFDSLWVCAMHTSQTGVPRHGLRCISPVIFSLSDDADVVTITMHHASC